MTFPSMVLKNLTTRPARSLLTSAGIAIAIAAVVALTSIAWGFENSWTNVYVARGTDLVVTKAGSLSPVATTFEESKLGEIAATPGVADATGMLADVMSVEEVPVVLVFGWQPGTYAWRHVRLVSGRWPSNDDERTVVLGTIAAEVLEKGVGSHVQVQAINYEVSGIFESGALAENGAIIMRLKQLQRLSNKPGEINFINLKLTDPARTQEMRKEIRSAHPDFKAVTAGEVADSNAAIRVAKAMSEVTAGIAFVIGAVGVMNTVLMSVFERIQDIGILLAVGWRRRRVMTMILFESIALGLAGGALGTLLGALVVMLAERTPLIRGKLEGEFSLPLFAVAFGLSLGLSVLGGLYPAYRASRMQPADALRYE